MSHPQFELGVARSDGGGHAATHSPFGVVDEPPPWARVIRVALLIGWLVGVAILFFLQKKKKKNAFNLYSGVLVLI
jgi:hypothetical protein